MGLEHGGILIIGTVVAALAAGGCGGDDGGGDATTTASPTAGATTVAETTTTPAPAAATVDASDPVARAASIVAKQKGGVVVLMHGTVVDPARATTISGKGSIDRSTGRGSFTINTGVGGAKVAVREVSDGKSVYVTSKIFKNRLPGKRSWMKIDLAKAAKGEGLDPSALGTNGPTQDPSQVLDYLQGAGPAKKLGTAKIRGVATTHYRVDADLDKAVAKNRSQLAKDTIAQLQATLGSTKTIPVDVWLDSRHRVRRERVRYTATIKNVASKFDFTTDFTGFGVAIKITTPPANDTVDGLALLQKAAALQQQQNG
ncbi:MAG TPA: hypothetical protein VNT55_09470 [Baekduia sp.]|nr:hypothetical protein [Baekduia sp.]